MLSRIVLEGKTKLHSFERSCYTCKYLERGRQSQPGINCTKWSEEKMDIVTGGTFITWPKDCYRQRSSRSFLDFFLGRKKCGPAGKYWESYFETKGAKNAE